MKQIIEIFQINPGHFNLDTPKSTVKNIYTSKIKMYTSTIFISTGSPLGNFEVFLSSSNSF